VEELSRLLLLLLFAAVLINLLRGGPAGVALWARAKFLGKSA
jgi:hypothetical protein